MYGNNYTAKQREPPNYEEDISDSLWSKGEKDVENWRKATLNMASRLREHPDPTKPDPSYLIKKLTNRALQMENHLLARKTIVKSSTLSVSTNGNVLERLMQQSRDTATNSASGSSGSTATSLARDELWTLAAPPVHPVPPPHRRAIQATQLTIDALIEKEGVIEVDKEPFVFNENGI